MEPDTRHPYLPPEPKRSPAAASVFSWAQQPKNTPEPTAPPLPPPVAAEALAQQQRLEQELEAARAELAAMHDLLEEIPQIFERKFQQRLQPVLADNAQLRQQLQQLQGTAAPGRQPQLPPARRPPKLRKALRHAFGLPAPQRRRDDDTAQAA